MYIDILTRIGEKEVPSPERVEDIEERARRIEVLWQSARLRGPVEIKRGVQRFRTLEEAQQERELRTQERMRRLRNQ